MITRDMVMEALKDVQDPELHRSLIDLGMISDVTIHGHDVTVTVALTTKGCPLKDTIRGDVRAAVAKIEGIGQIDVKLGEMTPEQRRDLLVGRLNAPIVAEDSKTRIIGVASGKGGVGKSTVTVNLAAALRQLGFDVGILDCDIYGFSVPRMVGIEGQKPTVIDGKIIPIPAHGMKIISMGNFVEENTPVVWRGPMLGKILRQFLTDVVWGSPDFLLLDLPPGTGDMAMDVAQLMPRSDLVIVTTPQVVAAGVATRAAQMSKKTNQRILGVIENMSSFICPCCGEATPIFGEGGGQAVADELEVPLLGQIPLTLEARNQGDQGTPVALSEDSKTAVAFRDIAMGISKTVGAQPV